MPLPVPPEIEETQENPRRRRLERQAGGLGRGGQPLAVHGRLDRLREVFQDSIQVVDEGQAPQRAKTLRLRRAGNVVNPAPAQPLQMIARFTAVVGRLAERQEDSRIVAERCLRVCLGDRLQGLRIGLEEEKLQGGHRSRAVQSD